ncbi:hypothetical protein Trydic_g11061 [Trypoxylus dichotomus]
MDPFSGLSVMQGPISHLEPKPLHRLFEDVVDTKGDNIALIFEEGNFLKRCTYKELNDLSNRLARALRDSIIKYSLAGKNDEDYIVAVSIFPKPKVDEIIQECKPAVVIYEEDSSSFLNMVKFPYEFLLELSAGSANSNLSNSERLKEINEDLAIVLSTSGSTGKSKGVKLPHKVILNRLKWQFDTFPYGFSEEIGVFKTALTFVDSVCEIWGPLISGLSIVVMQKAVVQDPERLIALLEKYRIERLVLVPSLLKSLLMYLKLQRKIQALSSLKLWICSGETLPVSLVKEFYEYFPENEYRLCNFYGSTEIMGDVTYHIVAGINQLQHQDKVPIGLPINNTIIYILDPNLCPVKTGEIGELYVSGLNVADGYVGDRDADKFIKNHLTVNPMFSRLYRTGDFARIENDMIIYEGRTDSQVKIRGHRVNLLEVENAITSIEGVENATVLCYKPDQINHTLLAFIVTRATTNEHQIDEILRSKLPIYMVPQVILLDRIPLLVNGKVDRQLLLKFYCNVSNNGAALQANIDYKDIPKEKMKAATVLFEAVASVLNRAVKTVICSDANFYDIGGNSLNSIYTIMVLSEKGYNISIGDFIAAKNLGEILDKIDNNQGSFSISQQPLQTNYTLELLKDEHKADALEIISTSFYKKGDLEQWIVPNNFVEDYWNMIDQIWEPLVENGLCFVAKGENGSIDGVALNYDARNKPKVNISPQLNIVFDFLENIERPVRDNVLLHGKEKILRAFLVCTRSTLAPAENVAIVNFLESNVLKLAKERKFAGIFTINTSPLTQQLGSDFYGYETLYDYQVNKYVASDGTKPFGMAPDSQKAQIQWKRL